jgi:2-oxo-4-hydroxy-4-carboxy-5-ureidoimidazoline decarboxylase
MSSAQAAELLRPCLDVDRWVTTVVEGRPYQSLEDLFAAARAAAHPFTGAELEAALVHHPRIGERAQGSSAEASLSRAEQGSLTLDDDVQHQLKAGNEAYEQRFGRVFLIRAAGRTSEQVLDSLRQRLANDPEAEDEVVADQLRQIAMVRLAAAVSP